MYAEIWWSAGELGLLRDQAERVGYKLEPLRVLDILLWTEVEPRGYYRAIASR